MAAKPKAKAQDAEQKWRNRIVSYGVKPADQFTHNPSNPKYHPPEQRAALKGALGEIGWIDTAVENVRTGYLIDGHERVWSALENNEEVPFIQVDLSPEEEAYALATLDPIGMMARHDAEKLDALLREVNSGEAGVQAMLAALAQDMGIMPPDFQPVDIGEQPRLDQKKPIICPHCGHEFIHHG